MGRLIIGGQYSYLTLPFPTIGKYVGTLSPNLLLMEKFDLKINYLGILGNIFILLVSLYMVFNKKIRLNTWTFLFTIFISVVITFFAYSESKVF